MSLNLNKYPRTFRIYWIILFLTICGFSVSAQINNTYAIRDYGATGQKEQLATAALQNAIDACADARGGMVYVAPGQYTIGSITLKSNIRLHLEAGATLFASQDSSQYPRHLADRETVKILLYGENLHNVVIEGKGLIDGDAAYERPTTNPRESIEYRSKKLTPIVNILHLVNCTNVLLQDFSIIRSMHWATHIWGCNRVFIRGLQIDSELNVAANSDGIDLDCSQDVTISDCIISTADDAICLKTKPLGGKLEPIENITVTNCVLTSSSAAFKIGTETHADLHHIVFSNSVIRNSNRGVGIWVRDGATVSDILISNITMDLKRAPSNWWGCGDALFFFVEKRHPQSRVGTIRDITITNVVARAEGTSSMQSFPGTLLQNIKLNDIQLFMKPETHIAKNATHSLRFNGLQNLEINDLDVNWDEKAPEPNWGSALVLQDVHNASIRNFRGRQGLLHTKKPTISLYDSECIQLTVEEFTEGAATPFIRIAGPNNKHIRLPSHLLNPLSKVSFSGGANREALSYPAKEEGAAVRERNEK